MSESSHTIDSVQIFRKDQNNKIYKPKPKRLRVISKEDELIIKRDEKTEQLYGKSGKVTQAGEGTAGGTGGGGSGGY